MSGFNREINIWQMKNNNNLFHLLKLKLNVSGDISLSLKDSPGTSIPFIVIPFEIINHYHCANPVSSLTLYPIKKVLKPSCSLVILH